MFPCLWARSMFRLAQPPRVVAPAPGLQQVDSRLDESTHDPIPQLEVRRGLELCFGGLGAGEELAVPEQVLEEIPFGEGARERLKLAPGQGSLGVRKQPSVIGRP